MKHQHASKGLELQGKLPAMALAGSSKICRIVARIMAVVFVLMLLGVIVLPWQQNVPGAGRVIAFDPLDRRVNVEAPVSGRVKKLYVVEGQRVKKGDLLIEIQDNDPNLLANLRLQRDAAIARRAAAKQRVEDLTAQISELELAKTQAIDAARQRIAAEDVTARTAALNWDRTKPLADKGLVSTRDMELATLAKDSSAANLAAAQSTLLRTEREFDANIANIRANRGTAQGDVASAERETASIDTQINQSLQQLIESPRDGIVLSVTATDGTYLRPGSPICVVIPETESRFVELWVDGNDIPLVSSRQTDESGKTTPGSLVRLQFEGWPAIQFIGWPSVAVGTFGGEVIFVDATDDGKGKFRVIVAPKPDERIRNGVRYAENWPGTRWLRQGVRTKGWVLLKQVPLWKEIWRQLNGFPPVVADTEPGEKK